MSARPQSLVVITDRGGHLHNSLSLIGQMGLTPDAILLTPGPELDSVKNTGSRVFEIPYLFSWKGKTRRLDPVQVSRNAIAGLRLALRLRPTRVISLGASDVIPFCFWAWLLGAKIYHVECMNQVVHPSVTGRMLYPICRALYVQWPELLSRYGSKAHYRGWVLSHDAAGPA